MKISKQDALHIIRRNVAPFVDYELTEKPYGYKLTYTLKLVPYLLLFVPVHIIKAFVCMWDGGLKEFSIERRVLSSEEICSPSGIARVHEILDKRA